MGAEEDLALLLCMLVCIPGRNGVKGKVELSDPARTMFAKGYPLRISLTSLTKGHKGLRLLKGFPLARNSLIHHPVPIKWHPYFVIMYDRLLSRVYRATSTVVDGCMKTYSRLIRYDVTMTKYGCHLIGSPFTLPISYRW